MSVTAMPTFCGCPSGAPVTDMIPLIPWMM
jgi:hypothetical protein